MWVCFERGRLARVRPRRFQVVGKAEAVSGSMPLSGSINLKTGLLTVTLGNGADKTTGYGVILLNATNGGGYLLTKTNA